MSFSCPPESSISHIWQISASQIHDLDLPGRANMFLISTVLFSSCCRVRALQHGLNDQAHVSWVRCATIHILHNSSLRHINDQFYRWSCRSWFVRCVEYLGLRGVWRVWCGLSKRCAGRSSCIHLFGNIMSLRVVTYWYGYGGVHFTWYIFGNREEPHHIVRYLRR